MIVDIGPTTLVASFKKDGKRLDLDRSYLEERVKSILSELRDVLPLLKVKAYLIKKTSALPDVAKKMINACMLVDGKTLTPMAAVAGAVSDVLIERVIEDWDVDFAYINNGGDISAYSKRKTYFRIKVADINSSTLIDPIFVLSGLERVGVATSGFGGRSFTLGICDLVTVFAESGAIADASATFICNATYVDSPSVKKKRAKDLDPLSDLDEEVVVFRGKLTYPEMKKALESGLDVAYKLKKSKVIFDAYLRIGDLSGTTINEDSRNIKMEGQDGDTKNSNSNRGDIRGW
ncbi:MAG: UPF0280 family protein [Desulfobacterota bacterium]|nr:UPF0280 family protein [Thermodesulfobacteriota bacterium]MDW8002522.1 UPF0280 family protein [Deltaproteobacteria bacterium]